MNRKTIAIFAATLFVVVSLSYLMFGHTWFGQMRHMRMARQHLPEVIRAIGADPAFRDIKVGVGTGGDGSILVVGRVSAQSDLDKLEAVIAGTQPPVKVTFSVTVGDGR